MILKLTDIEYSYPDGLEALKGVNACVENKSFVVVLGESGCGKTTLFKTITGIYSPSKGSIEINDQDVTNLTTSSRDLTMIFQNFVLYPHMTIYENVMTALNGFGLSNEEMDTRTKNILNEFGLLSYLNFKPRHLSDGQKQRIAMCRALIREPSLFLMDEPLSNLDLPQRVRIKQELKEIFNKYNSTFIYITHDLNDAITLSTTIWIMDRGKIVQTGTFNEIKKLPKTYKACFMIYGGNINEFKITYKNKTILHENFNIHFESDKQEKEYTMCVPYDGVRIDPKGNINAIITTKKITPDGILLTARTKNDTSITSLISEDEDEKYEYEKGQEASFSFLKNKIFLYKARN